MSRSRRYQLLCPIARALDRVGDRWALLILRDLHAGPARFSDLLAGLTGVASNLLTTRLQQLADDGLVRRREGEFGAALYELTELGERSNDLLFELARFGGRFAPDEEPRAPGNLRTIAVTLKTALRRVARAGDDVTAELTVDGEPYRIDLRDGSADVRAGAAPEADVRIVTSYEPLLDVGEGRLSLEDFTTRKAQASARDPAKLERIFARLSEALALLRDDR